MMKIFWHDSRSQTTAEREAAAAAAAAAVAAGIGLLVPELALQLLMQWTT